VSAVTFELPPRWYWWDPDDPEAATARDLDARIAQRPAVAPARHILLAVLLRLWDDAADEQAIAAGALAEPAPDGIVLATLVAMAAERTHPRDEDREIAAVLELLRTDSPFDVRPREVAVVDLPAGRAVRLKRVARTDTAGSGESEGVVGMVPRWVPLRDEEALLVLAGSTPCLVAADELETVFDSVARSVTIEPGVV